MLKMRGGDSPAAGASTTGRCALGSAAERKLEVDVTMLANDQVKRAPSFSCTLEDERDLAFMPELACHAQGLGRLRGRAAGRTAR